MEQFLWYWVQNLLWKIAMEFAMKSCYGIGYGKIATEFATEKSLWNSLRKHCYVNIKNRRTSYVSSPIIGHIFPNCISRHPLETLAPPLDLTVSLNLQSVQSGVGHET
ncbi:unnamed protein product [Lactuca saligna]|uniref:Uncharacterized protein n=1 Tax=Lactuca saligna TaxID=75948 RepID=A0AA35ZKJ1_LACSI|nr:unnamed protein product [Lactuca saligna]